MHLTTELSERVFGLRTTEEADAWLVDVEREIGAISWKPVGGFEDNIHAIDVSADPALALVERVTNATDAMLELRAVQLSQTASSPRLAARHWYNIPPGGLTDLTDAVRRDLASNITVTLDESEDRESPTVTIQDKGCGVSPSDFPSTLLSLMAGNKKTKHHLMGVYNAGGAATLRFCSYAIIVSRRCPALLDGKPDETGVVVIKYNDLSDEYKTGTYEFCTDTDGEILRLGVPALPETGYGTSVRHIRYKLRRYASMAWGPKASLWHLLHATLFDPPLPVMIRDRRAEQYAEVKRNRGEVTRVVTGLRHLLHRGDIAQYSEERQLFMGPDYGSVTLRYWVFADTVQDPDAYIRPEQALTLTLNGQRQGTRDRQWLRRRLDLHYLFNRMVVQVDCDGLTPGARREVFAATRESHTESKLTDQILDRVCEELKEDTDLGILEDQRRERALAGATETASERITKMLADRIAAGLPGAVVPGAGGPSRQKKRRKSAKKTRKTYDDAEMLDVPDSLAILTKPVLIEPGHTASLWVGINAKNGFLPRHRDSFQLVIGPGLTDDVKVRSVGSLLGGETRIILEASDSTPTRTERLSVALVIPDMGVMLTDVGELQVTEPTDEEPEDDRGGRPNVKITWAGRDKWEIMGRWDERTVGVANLTRDDGTPSKVSKAEFVLNSAFFALENAILAKGVSETGVTAFKDAYAYPVCWALFEQAMCQEVLVPKPVEGSTSEQEGEEESTSTEEAYQKAEKERLARAVLMALEPRLDLVASDD